MKKYSILHIPILSFFKKDLYQDVCFNWKGSGFFYLFILLFICWLFPSFQIDNSFENLYKKEAPPYVSQIPEIIIRNGEAHVKVNQPYIIVDPETNENLAVIDTTGVINTLDEANARILITKDEMIVQKSAIEERSFQFRTIDNFIINQNIIHEWFNYLNQYIGFLFFLICFPFSFLFRIVMALVYSLIGFIIASIYKTNKSFGQLVRLSVVAMTPGIILQTVLHSLKVNIPFYGVIFFVLTIIYLVFGIKASRNEK
jgi:hypothetical protein